MSRQNMGSRPREQLVSITEASRMIGLSVSTLRRMSQEGTIEAVCPDGSRGAHFRAHDLSALAEVRSRKLDLPGIAQIAMQAYVTARANERRLDDLFDALGLDLPLLETSEEEVVALYLRAQEVPAHLTILGHESVREWAKALYAMDATYLTLVQQITGSDEPWKVFLDLGEHLIAHGRGSSYEEDLQLQSAHRLLRTAYNNFRAVAYFFCQQKIGKKAAKKVFGEEADHLDANVCRTLFPDLRHV